MTNRRNIHASIALGVAVLLIACGAVRDADERTGQVAAPLSTDVCLGGADSPSLLPKWSTLYSGRFAASTVISGTVSNTDVVDIPARIDVRMAGGDARVISTTLWQGTLARGATQTVSLRLDALPIRSFNVASAAEIVVTATGVPRRGDSVYSAPLYATYDPNRATFSLTGSAPPQGQFITTATTFSAAVGQLLAVVQPLTRRPNGGTALSNGQFLAFTDLAANGSDAFVHAQWMTVGSADSAKLSSMFQFNTAPVDANYAPMRICAKYGGFFIDDSKGESVGGTTLPARFARAALARNGFLPDWSGTLDAAGCSPNMTLLDFTDYTLLVMTDLQDNALGGSHNVHIADATGNVQTQAIGFSTQRVRRASASPPFSFTVGGFGSGDNAMRVAGVLGQAMTLPFGSMPPGAYNVNANQRCNGDAAASTACFSPAASTLFIGPNIDGTHNSQYKFVVAHEFGHAIQQAAIGGLHTDYARDTTLNENGPCGCGFVSDPTDRAHCLQSRQKLGAVEAESFAHYVAANTWNGSSGACTFVYYKNSLEADGTTITKPPFGRSCNAQTRWLENHCAAASRGVEWDWLNFFRGAGAGGAPIPIADVHSIFRQACGGMCSTASEPSYNALQSAALAYYGGNPSDARYVAFQAAGINYGVKH